MTFSSIFALIAAGLALVSAGLWAACYFIDVPKGSIWIEAGVGGGRPNEEIDKLVSAIRQQSKLNALAAGFAGRCTGIRRTLGLRPTARLDEIARRLLAPSCL